MFKWALLAMCVFCGVNWFLLPTFPALAQYVPPLSIWAAIGLSAIVMALSLCFGKD